MVRGFVVRKNDGFLDFHFKGFFWTGAETLRRVNFLCDFTGFAIAKKSNILTVEKRKLSGGVEKTWLLHDVEGAERIGFV